MSEQQSPWSRPESGVAEYPVAPVPPDRPSPQPFNGQHHPAAQPSGGQPRPGSQPLIGPGSQPSGRVHPQGGEVDLGPGWSRSGGVTLLGSPSPRPDVLQIGPDDEFATQRRRMFKVFGGVAGAIAAVGMVVILALVITGHSPLRNPLAHGPKDVLPPLAQACPPPSADAGDLPAPPPAPPGPRTVDTESGISYAREGTPWQPWNELWSAGDLHVRYGIGQHFVTETYIDSFGVRSQYHASILSGSVPAAANDALTLDLKCTGHQVLADVRLSYYPQPNTIEMMRDEVTVLGGRPAWVAKFRLHFHESGLKATSELVGLALVNVGRPNAAVLYISIPGTHPQFDPVVDTILDSVRPT